MDRDRAAHSFSAPTRAKLMAARVHPRRLRRIDPATKAGMTLTRLAASPRFLSSLIAIQALGSVIVPRRNSRRAPDPALVNGQQNLNAALEYLDCSPGRPDRSMGTADSGRIVQHREVASHPVSIRPRRCRSCFESRSAGSASSLNRRENAIEAAVGTRVAIIGSGFSGFSCWSVQLLRRFLPGAGSISSKRTRSSGMGWPTRPDPNTSSTCAPARMSAFAGRARTIFVDWLRDYVKARGDAGPSERLGPVRAARLSTALHSDLLATRSGRTATAATSTWCRTRPLALCQPARRLSVPGAERRTYEVDVAVLATGNFRMTIRPPITMPIRGRRRPWRGSSLEARPADRKPG